MWPMIDIGYYKSSSIVTHSSFDYYLPKQSKWWIWIWDKLVRYGLIEKHENPATRDSIFTQVTLDMDELVGTCDKLVQDYEMYTGRRATKIIVGRNIRRKLIKEMIDTALVVSVPSTQDYKNTWLFGIKVEFNPFIDGIVITGEE